MSKTTHAEEPWQYTPESVVMSGNVIGRIIAICDRFGDKRDQANAARIVSCVNACAGFEDPENLVSEYKSAITLLQKACNQRDEMLSLIREMVELKDRKDMLENAIKMSSEYKAQGHGMQLADEVHEMERADYTKRKEIAWQKMRQLAKLDKTEKA